MKLIPRFFFSIVLLVFAASHKLPEKGMPLLEYYTPAQYHNKGKVWDINSAPNGIVYMAADLGLLEFDGINWKSFKGSKGYTRSLLVVNDSVIFTGSDLDFGVWNKNEYQRFEYTSLYPFSNDSSQINEEFWQVHKLDANIVFVSSSNIFIYNNNQLTKIAAPRRFEGSFLVGNQLYFVDDEFGLFVFTDLSLKPVFSFSKKKEFRIVGIFENQNQLNIVTKDSGLFSLETGTAEPVYNTLSNVLRSANVFSFEVVGKNYLAFGTVLRGLYVADLEGNVIHQINRHKGLPNNTILSLHYNSAGMLWVGMDYGVASIDFQNNITFFNDFRGDFGTAQTALIDGEVFFLGTNQGLYTAIWKDLKNDSEFFDFNIVPGSKGQVWALEKIGDEILVGHDFGLLVIDQGVAKKLIDLDGVWNIVPHKQYLLAGNYNGISVLESRGGKWSFAKKLDLIYGSCNQVVIERDNILWVNIPNFGIIRAVLDEYLYPADRLIVAEDFFDGKYPYLHLHADTIRVTTDRHSYSFCEETMAFVKTDDHDSYSKLESLNLQGYSSIFLNQEYGFIPVSNGFALQKAGGETKRVVANHPLVFRRLEAFNNHERTQVVAGQKIPYSFNNIGVEFVVPNQRGVLYQFKLNQKGKWTDWTDNNKHEFFGLGEGNFTIHARANIDGELTEIWSTSIVISPPWHRTWIAYVIYLFLIGISGFLLFRYQRAVLKKQKMELLIKERQSLLQQAEKHRQQLSEIEQQKLMEEYDQVKNQLKNKTIELAKKAKEDEDKNRLLLVLKDKCDKALNDNSITMYKLKEMNRLMEAYLKVEDRTFEIQMDELHQEFFRKLKERFPDLSNNDLRLCAYLKIGLNSKEIADLLNIQPSSSYISRSRLRKKMELKPDEDLYGFLNKI